MTIIDEPAEGVTTPPALIAESPPRYDFDSGLTDAEAARVMMSAGRPDTFCSACLEPLGSRYHHAECVAPLDQLGGDA